MDAIPPLSADLIEELDKHYKPITVDDLATTDDFARGCRAGARSVVELLLMRIEQSKDNALNV